MAQAIAQKLISEFDSPSCSISVNSAGVSAGDGYQASPQAVEALTRRQIDLSGHQSKMITPELIKQADLIFTMTPAHAQAVIGLVQGAIDKVFPLDTRHPIADPFGQPVEVYCDVADELEPLTQIRLEEILA